MTDTLTSPTVVQDCFSMRLGTALHHLNEVEDLMTSFPDVPFDNRCKAKITAIRKKLDQLEKTSGKRE